MYDHVVRILSDQHNKILCWCCENISSWETVESQEDYHVIAEKEEFWREWKKTHNLLHNLPKEHTYKTYGNYAFRNKENATLFKLTWS